jgi:large subunit ribosomal protein L1
MLSAISGVPSLPLDSNTLISTIDQVKKASKKRNFVQSIDLIVALKNIDVKKPENRLNELIRLPRPLTKKNRVCVIASGSLAVNARNAGADYILSPEQLETFSEDKKAAKRLIKDYDSFLAEAPLMPLVGRILGPILGPRGKMPTPVPPNVEVGPVLQRQRASVRVRIRDQLSASCTVGDEEMDSNHIVENIQALISRLEEKYEKDVNDLGVVYLKSTMGSPVKVNENG